MYMTTLVIHTVPICTACYSGSNHVRRNINCFYFNKTTYPTENVCCTLFTYARFTLAKPTPRLASDVVGGKSGQNHPTSRQDPIHIG